MRHYVLGRKGSYAQGHSQHEARSERRLAAALLAAAAALACEVVVTNDRASRGFERRARSMKESMELSKL